MTPERWQQIGELYHAALELRPEQRAAFLEEACAGDQELFHEVESLILAEERAEDFIEDPAVKDAARIMVDDQSALSASVIEGNEFGHYQIISLLGAGGMAEVYLAHDQRLERKVALKLLPAYFTRDEARVRRFIKEARAVSTLNHPNIITIHEVGEIDGRRYIATEFIEGQTLRQKMVAGRMNAPAVLDAAIQVASALNAAHAAGIVHRDVKPENIMVRPDGLVKVLDFGLAKLAERPASISATTIETQAPTEPGFKTAPGTVMGTVAYMSPEQARGWDVDARSDLFSLGVVIYEMIAGCGPFRGETMNHVIVAILDQDPTTLSQHAPEVPSELERIVNKALQKESENRYQSAAELLVDLNALKQKTELQVNPITIEKWDPPRDSVIEGQGPKRTAAEGNATPTGATTVTIAKLGGEHLLRQIRRYSRRAALAMVVLTIVAVALFIYFNRAPALTEKDTVLLSDFVNLTGEEVFDNTLKQALALQLEQTPFLNFFPEERIRETLRYMGRSPDERVTKALGREICQRQGLKALLVGSIAQFDRRYSITLEAINSLTGETIAGALTEADGKDQVLQALGRASRQLRESLGESLASIQKFDAPLEQATTSSLEALKAWSRGVELTRSGKIGEAMLYYKRAKDLDPNFAKAYVSFSMAYSNQGQLDLAAEYAAKAYELRDRTTEREKFDIASNYHSLVTGNLIQAIEIVEIWRQTYPRDYGPRARLASLYRLVGEIEKSLAVAREANQLNPRAYVPYVNQGTSLMQLNRFDEARAVIEDALAQQFDSTTSRRDLFQIGFIKGDAAIMKQQIDWATGKPGEYWAFHWQAQAAAFSGQLRRATELYRLAASLVETRNSDRAARFVAEAALRSAVCGLCPQLSSGKATLQPSTRLSLQSYTPANISWALTFALCGETGRAQSLADEVAVHNPQSTLANFVWLPAVRAAIELRRGNSELAIQSLQTTTLVESAGDFWPIYLRGQAYLRLSKGEEAAAEFKKILDHRGWDAASILYPLAHLGLARASALTGDIATSRDAYQSFLAIWKDADPDTPILQAARREYDKLN